jgi:hypothetical protein
VWTKDGQQFTAVLTISINGNRVNVKRRNATLGGNCELNGILGVDGVTVTGTNICTQGRGATQARIECEQSGSRGCGLGTRWRVTDGGWNGIWTRRGNSNVFDAVWTKAGQQFTAVLTISINGNRVNVKRRNATLGGNCELNGILGVDGVTVTGTNICTQGRGVVQARIECER